MNRIGVREFRALSNSWFCAAVDKVTDMTDQQMLAHLGQVWLSAQAVRTQSSIV